MGRFEKALQKAAKDRGESVVDIPNSSQVFDEVGAKNIETRLITHFPKKSLYAEQYTTLMVNLERKLKHNSKSSILITSSARGEGKTTTAINLAYTLAQDLDTKDIILVDGDLRKPTINVSLGLKSEIGLQVG